MRNVGGWKGDGKAKKPLVLLQAALESSELEDSPRGLVLRRSMRRQVRHQVPDIRAAEAGYEIVAGVGLGVAAAAVAARRDVVIVGRIECGRRGRIVKRRTRQVVRG